MCGAGESMARATLDLRWLLGGGEWRLQGGRLWWISTRGSR